jgi:folate-binding protein YgfZ
MQLGIDVHVGLAQTLLEKLKMYKLRSDVEIKEGDLSVALGLTKAPTGALSDPRHPKMGWRLYRRDAAEFNQMVDWTKLRIDYMIPEYGSELTEESYILEMGFERLQGVDFKKGCYVGQEVTARMKHKTELKKGLVRVQSDQNIFFGDELFVNERSVGSVLTSHETRALAYVRIKNKSDILSTKNSEKVVIDREPISSR